MAVAAPARLPGAHLPGDGGGHRLKGAHAMLTRLFPPQGKAGKHLPQARAEPAELHPLQGYGKKQAGAAQQDNQQMIPEKALRGPG